MTLLVERSESSKYYKFFQRISLTLFDDLFRVLLFRSTIGEKRSIAEPFYWMCYNVFHSSRFKTWNISEWVTHHKREHQKGLLYFGKKNLFANLLEMWCGEAWYWSGKWSLIFQNVKLQSVFIIKWYQVKKRKNLFILFNVSRLFQ